MDFIIDLDSGGGMLLQTDTYCHAYDDPKQLAEDVQALMAGSDPDNWDGNQPEYRIDETGSEVTRRDVARGYRTQETGAAEFDFWMAINA